MIPVNAFIKNIMTGMAGFPEIVNQVFLDIGSHIIHKDVHNFTSDKSLLVVVAYAYCHWYNESIAKKTKKI